MSIKNQVQVSKKFNVSFVHPKIRGRIHGSSLLAPKPVIPLAREVVPQQDGCMVLVSEETIKELSSGCRKAIDTTRQTRSSIEVSGTWNR